MLSVVLSIGCLFVGFSVVQSVGTGVTSVVISVGCVILVLWMVWVLLASVLSVL